MMFLERSLYETFCGRPCGGWRSVQRTGHRFPAPATASGDESRSARRRDRIHRCAKHRSNSELRPRRQAARPTVPRKQPIPKPRCRVCGIVPSRQSGITRSRACRSGENRRRHGLFVIHGGCADVERPIRGGTPRSCHARGRIRRPQAQWADVRVPGARTNRRGGARRARTLAQRLVARSSCLLAADGARRGGALMGASIVQGTKGKKQTSLRSTKGRARRDSLRALVCVFSSFRRLRAYAREAHAQQRYALVVSGARAAGVRRRRTWRERYGSTVSSPPLKLIRRVS